MTTPEPQTHDPQRIVAWAQRSLPPGELHHGIVELDVAGSMLAACGELIASSCPHCFHVGPDRDVEPKCPTCRAAADRDRKAQAVYELEISSTYSRYG